MIPNQFVCSCDVAFSWLYEPEGNNCAICTCKTIPPDWKFNWTYTKSLVIHLELLWNSVLSLFLHNLFTNIVHTLKFFFFHPTDNPNQHFKLNCYEFPQINSVAYEKKVLMSLFKLNFCPIEISKHSSIQSKQGKRVVLLVPLEIFGCFVKSVLFQNLPQIFFFPIQWASIIGQWSTAMATKCNLRK